MNMVTVKINGMEYNLKGDENEEYLHKVALNVDKRVKYILQSNKMLSTTSASILTAINMMDEIFKAQKKNDEYINKINQYEAKQKEYEKKLNDLTKEATGLKGMNEKLQSKISENKEDTYSIKNSEEFKKLNEQIDILSEEGKMLKNQNKELEVELEASKYKVLDLQNKILEKKVIKGNKYNNKKNIK